MTTAATAPPRRQDGGLVMAWTVFTTTFLWTPTMRGLFRPDVSSWAVMEMRGSGRADGFWLFPLLAALALLLFYLDGRGRLRPLFHALLLGWHAAVTGIVLTGVLRGGPGASFEGAMWGVRAPLGILAVPFVVFFGVALRWAWREWRARPTVAPAPWRRVHWPTLAAAAALMPLAIILFRLGQGIDWPTRLATAATIAQWILLTQGLSHRTRAGAE